MEKFEQIIQANQYKENQNQYKENQYKENQTNQYKENQTNQYKENQNQYKENQNKYKENQYKENQYKENQIKVTDFMDYGYLQYNIPYHLLQETSQTNPNLSNPQINSFGNNYQEQVNDSKAYSNQDYTKSNEYQINQLKNLKPQNPNKSIKKIKHSPSKRQRQKNHLTSLLVKAYDNEDKILEQNEKGFHNRRSAANRYAW
ncbi:hypothetical protein M0811_09781 [Anaeramoeba ignava]|uniref:Uncharacterized protein n=1 Tax=Anaeramoeba ignava TaxID=1746090 RepID=A0A9Q0LFD9_ANAIG|nr:hypothetical protein M0811_09781 [Anaeramoeba ignava]